MPGIDSNTKLMLHFDGDVTDSSASAHTVTNNNVTFASTTPKFSQYSVYNFVNGYLSVADNSDFDFGSGAFTIDGWINIASTAVGPLTVWCKATDANNGTAIVYRPDAGGVLVFYQFQSGVFDPNLTSLTVMSINTWYHFAVIRGWGGNVNSWALCINGTAEATATNSNPFFYLSRSAQIGNSDNYGASFGLFDGLMDEFRISKGIARWTSNFTPPTQPYSSSSGGILTPRRGFWGDL
jgi:hypothetical protein